MIVHKNDYLDKMEKFLNDVHKLKKKKNSKAMGFQVLLSIKKNRLAIFLKGLLHVIAHLREQGDL